MQFYSLATLTEVFPSVVRQMPGYNSQRLGTANTLPNLFVLFSLLFVFFCCQLWCSVYRLCVNVLTPSLFMSVERLLLLRLFESVSLLVTQLGCVYLVAEMYGLVDHLVLLYMNRIRALWSLSIHNFSIIGVQLFLVLLLGYEFRLLGIIVVGRGLQ
jgi:hypothetical protein